MLNKHKIIKLLITDSVFPKNRGDNAILLGMIEDIKHEIPDAKITILSSYPEDAKNRLPFQVYPSISNLLGSPPFSFIRMLIILFMIKLPRLPSYKTIEQYRKADIVVSCGGSFVTDTYLSLYKILFGYFISKQLKKPLVLYAQSIGPFRFSFYKKLTFQILKMADLIITRDYRSFKLIKNLNKTTTYLSVDAALNLPASEKDMRNEKNIPNNKFLVGISTRKWIYPGVPNPFEQIKNYKVCIAKIADYLIERYNAHIVFASTCFGEGNYKFNDVEMSKKIFKLMKNKDDVTIIKKTHTASELKKLFGEMDFCICTRMHTLIFATSMYTPSIGIKYEFKTEEYMKRLDLTKYKIDILDIKYEELKQKVDRAIENIEKIVQKLQEKIPELQKKSKESAKLLSDFINKNI